MKQLIIILFSVSLIACASPKVLDVSTAPEADFSKYKTFAFYELTAFGDTITEVFNDRVGYLKKVIASEMEQRQFKQARSTNQRNRLENRWNDEVHGATQLQMGG